jgi:hypothetical protein
VNYWLPIPVGALLWLTLRHHSARPGPADADDQRPLTPYRRRPTATTS